MKDGAFRRAYRIANFSFPYVKRLLPIDRLSERPGEALGGRLRGDVDVALLTLIGTHRADEPDVPVTFRSHPVERCAAAGHVAEQVGVDDVLPIGVIAFEDTPGRERGRRCQV